MKKLFIALTGVLVGVASLVALSTATAQAAPNKCEVNVVGSQNTANGPNSKFTKNGTKVTAKLKVTGSNCNVPVTLMSWEAPNAEARPLSAQKLYKVNKETFKTGTHSISVEVPQCFFQVDFIRGHKVAGANGAHHYGPEINMGWLLGGQKKCQKSQPPKPQQPPQAPVPEFSCTMLGVAANADRTVKVTAFRTASKNAVYKRAVINWGDNQSTPVTNNAVNTTHTYAQDGVYTITATAYFTHKNSANQVVEKSTTSAACTSKVTFTANPPVVEPPATPQTPATVTPVSATGGKSLPDTGAGSVVAIFGGVSSLAGLGHWFIRRRFF